MESIVFFRQFVSEKIIEIDEAKIKVIKACPTSKMVSEVISFHGFGPSRTRSTFVVGG